jgi:hypothetical protein
MENVTLTLTPSQINWLEEAIQRDAVNFLQNDGRQGKSFSDTVNSDYYRENREMFGIIYDANPANGVHTQQEFRCIECGRRNCPTH